jgi:hypothetical protein
MLVLPKTTQSSVPPSNPVAGDYWINDATMRRYVWYVMDNDQGQWVQADQPMDIGQSAFFPGTIGPIGPAPTFTNSTPRITLGPSPPGNPTIGDLWWSSITGQQSVWYDDSNTLQWVISNYGAGPQGPMGTPGAGFPTGGTVGQSLVKATGYNYDTIWDSRVLWVPYTGVAGQQYLKQNMTRDGDWTMVANKDTTARPAPQPSGSEEDLLPVWVPTTSSANAGYTVYNEWTTNTAGWLSQYGVDVLAQNVNAQHVITLRIGGVVKDTFTATPNASGIYWHDITPLVVANGSVIRVTLQVNQPPNNLYWRQQLNLFATAPVYCSGAVGSKDGAAAGTTAYGCHVLFTPGAVSADWDIAAYGGEAAGGGSGVAEAPLDGTTYGRLNAQWTALSGVYAPLVSPIFTGDPQAPTPATADNDTSVATTAFVKAQGYGTGTLTGVTAGAGITVTGAAPSPTVAITNSITAGGPVGSGTAIPVITWNAQGQLTTVSSATVSIPPGTYVGDTPPASPTDNQLWWKSDTGILYIYYNDGNSSQWVPATPVPPAQPSSLQLYSEVNVTTTGVTTMTVSFPNSARKIEIEYLAMTIDGSGQNLQWQWMQGGSVYTTANYAWQVQSATGTTLAASGGLNAAAGGMGGGTANKGILRCTPILPSGTGVVEGTGYIQSVGGARNTVAYVGDAGAAANTITGVRLSYAAGTQFANGSFARCYVVP